MKNDKKLLFEVKKYKKVPMYVKGKGVMRALAKPGCTSWSEEKVPFETVNGRRLYYEIHGMGEPIVLLHHGFGCTIIKENNKEQTFAGSKSCIHVTLNP
jgi:hypothetical protein